MSDNSNQVKIKKIRAIYGEFNRQINSIHKEILNILKEHYRQQDAQKLEQLRNQIKYN